MGRAPNIEKLKSKHDLQGLLKAIQVGQDEVVRASGIDAIIDLVSAPPDGHIGDAFDCVERFAAALGSAAASGDKLALMTLVRIVAREFQDRGPVACSENLEIRASDALRLVGPHAVPPLLPLLATADPRACLNVANTLGGVGFHSGDGSALGPLVAKALEVTAKREQGRANKWAKAPDVPFFREIRESCFLACKNIQRANPDGYAQFLARASDEERAFLGVWPS